MISFCGVYNILSVSLIYNTLLFYSYLTTNKISEGNLSKDHRENNGWNHPSSVEPNDLECDQLFPWQSAVFNDPVDGNPHQGFDNRSNDCY